MSSGRSIVTRHDVCAVYFAFHRRHLLFANSKCRHRDQKTNRTCSWNIRGGSMFANAGIALVGVPTVAS